MPSPFEASPVSKSERCTSIEKSASGMNAKATARQRGAINSSKPADCQVADSHRVEKVVQGNAAKLQVERVSVQSKGGHAGDVFGFPLHHVVIEVMGTSQGYLQQVEKFGESQVKAAGIPQYQKYWIQYFPEGGFGIGSAVQVLLGIPIKGEVDIGTAMPQAGGWVGWIQNMLTWGKGYETNQPDHPSVFPSLPGMVDRIIREFSEVPGNPQASAQVELDPIKGDELLRRARLIDGLCKKEKYLYLVYDKIGPLVGSNVMGAKLRNCWGFVTDLFSYEFDDDAFQD